jgi:hypothetical protein
VLLKAFRRHKRGCAHKDEGREYRRCQCPIWIDGTVAGKEFRKSLSETNWEKAQNRVNGIAKNSSGSNLSLASL